MDEQELLRTVPIFAELSDPDIANRAAHSTEVVPVAAQPWPAACAASSQLPSPRWTLAVMAWRRIACQPSIGS